MSDEVLYFDVGAEINGVIEGESFTISQLVDGDEFILTIVEPEIYGEDRQVASACFSRQQLITITARITTALYPVSLED